MNTLSFQAAAGIAAVGATPLESRLRSLGIMPIPHSRIDAYKREQIRLHPPNLWGRLFRALGIPAHKVLGLSPGIIIGTTVTGFVIAATGFLCALFASVMQPIAVAPLLIAGVLGTVLLIGAIGVAFLTAAETIVRYPAEWKVSAWADVWTENAPGWVKERKMVVSRNIPGLTYDVHELLQSTVNIDPILEVIDLDTGERYAIAVWDENGNEVTL